MLETNSRPVLESFKKSAHITQQQYQQMYRDSIDNPDTFWATQAAQFLT